jgi:hypothetical protein
MDNRLDRLRPFSEEMERAEAEIDAKFKSTTVYQWWLIFGTFMGVFNFKIRKKRLKFIWDF